MRGFPIPNYPELRMGMPSKSALIRLWQLKRPDVIHSATEGPLGWSALRAAMYLRLPVSTDYRTNFQSYSAHYGIGFLYKPIMAYLRKFHNYAHCTMVPTEALRASLADAGFQRLKVVSRGVDTVGYDPAHRSEALRAQWGLDRPLPEQFVLWLRELARGNLGDSIFLQRPVTQALWERAEPTALLSLMAIAIAALIGVPCGLCCWLPACVKSAGPSASSTPKALRAWCPAPGRWRRWRSPSCCWAGR